MKILVTGANGFVGKNLISTLKHNNTYEVYEYDTNNNIEDLEMFTKDCDFVIHLAGVNRPENTEDFYKGNFGFTETLCKCLIKAKNRCPIMVSSSIQAERDNDYGKSKKAGEEFIQKYGKDNDVKTYIYRFSNLFGKWCKPNYNSVIATWCYNIAHGLTIQIDDENVKLDLCYIDDVVNEIINCLTGHAHVENGYGKVLLEYEVTLGELAKMILSFRKSRETLYVPDMSLDLERKLYSTYLNYLPKNEFSYPLKMNVDNRGSFTEFLKTHNHGQISVNISKPGIVKGNHWHHTKNEKFLVVSGKGLIQFRDIYDNEVIDYYKSGDKLEVIDIPTGYSHSITNLGDTDMVTIMWANEVFDEETPDTFYMEVTE